MSVVRDCFGPLGCVLYSVFVCRLAVSSFAFLLRGPRDETRGECQIVAIACPLRSSSGRLCNFLLLPHLRHRLPWPAMRRPFASPCNAPACAALLPRRLASRDALSTIRVLLCCFVGRVLLRCTPPMNARNLPPFILLPYLCWFSLCLLLV